jgi:drug/metabolite transporter (DMT)-like permease
VGLVVAVLLWGTSFVATKAALGGFPPLTVIGGRMLLAAALMLPFWRRLPRPARRPGDLRRIAVLVAFYPCLYYATESFAVSQTTASQAGTVSALAPLLVAAGAWVFLRERLPGRAVAGLLVSIGGVAVLSLGGGAAPAAPNPGLGNALEVGAIAFASASTITLKGLTGRWDPWLLTGLQMSVAAVVFLPAVLLTPIATWTSAPASAWIGLVWLGVAVTLPPSGLYNLAVSRMPAARAAMAINVIPVVAIVSGWAVQGDALSTVQWAACVVILGGVLLGQSGPTRAGTPEAGTPETATAEAEASSSTRSGPA